MSSNIATELLIGTNNSGKLREFTDLFGALPIRFRSLFDFPEVLEVDEIGETFADNAELKAMNYARQTRLWTLADDSGLEIHALHGAPGVFSARFAGEAATIQQRIEKLLNKLEETDDIERKAQFICVISLAAPTGDIVRSEMAICEGVIANEPRGKNGMGYDSIFIPNGFEKTFGELPEEVKRQVSHRAQAFYKMIEFLRKSDLLIN